MATFAWGYRSYNFHSAYGFGLQGYANARLDIARPIAWELTVGIEVDLAILVGIPLGFFSTRASKGPPHEPAGP
jgi:hypothetical protein